MNDLLKSRLTTAGWRSGTLRGYLMTRRVGIEFEIGPSRGGDGRLTLLYRYHTETSNTEGEEHLPGDADLHHIYDAMTGIYLRIHERPDPSRVFGGGRRRSESQPPAPSGATPAPTPDPTQGTLDF
jgi:hypothetical protein